jgi:hypothetical protein
MLVAVLLVVAMAAPAHGEFNSPGWDGPSGAPLTGNWMTSSPRCNGERVGGFVRAVQSFLWAMHHYGPPGANQHQVDGVWGGATREATRAYQRARRLADDGCVGAGTWRAFENQRAFVGFFEGGYYARYVVSDPRRQERITVDLSPFCWWTSWANQWWIWDSTDGHRCPIVNYEYSPPLVEGYERHP